MDPQSKLIKDVYGGNDNRDRVGLDYAVWFYASNVWLDMQYCGVRTLKSPQDMWNYQEIISKLKPGLVIEFGTFHGGAALYFANVLQQLGHRSRVLTVDPTDHGISPLVHQHPMIEQIRGMSVSQEVKSRIQFLRKEYPGPVFCILDGDHRAQNVFFELMMLRDLLVKGDYVINEDSNLNGHPIPAMTGEAGPWEALAEYQNHYPGDYIHDVGMEKRFGWTLATEGYLIKT